MQLFKKRRLFSLCLVLHDTCDSTPQLVSEHSIHCHFKGLSELETLTHLSCLGTFFFIMTHGLVKMLFFHLWPCLSPKPSHTVYHCNLHPWTAAQIELVLNCCDYTILYNILYGFIHFKSWVWHELDLATKKTWFLWHCIVYNKFSSPQLFIINQCLGQLLSASVCAKGTKNKVERQYLNQTFCWAALTPSAPLALMPPPPSGANQPVTVSRLQMQLHLQGLQQNTNALRKQLSQLRNMQVFMWLICAYPSTYTIQSAAAAAVY